MELILKFFNSVFKNIIKKVVDLTFKDQSLTPIDKIPVYRDRGKHIGILQRTLNKNGATLKVDYKFGKKTLEAVKRFQKLKGLLGTGKIGPKTLKWLGLELSKEVTTKVKKSLTPWIDAIEKDLGSHENDPKFSAKMIPKWPLVGLKLGTIAENWAAWCGLAVGVYLNKVKLPSQPDGALAKNWAKYGLKVDFKKDGIPFGAIVHINHSGKPQSKGNHVTFCYGDYSPNHFSKRDAVIACIGGNQNDQVKVSYYKAKKVLNVRWPNSIKYPLPGRVLETTNINGKVSKESTV